MFQGSTTSSYTNNIPQTTTYFYTNHAEDGTNGVIEYATFYDLAQSTNYQYIMPEISNAASASSCATLFLFSPGSTTYVKQWYSRIQGKSDYPDTREWDMAGYINTTSAITEASFKMASGNFDGKIKMYGVA